MYYTYTYTHVYTLTYIQTYNYVLYIYLFMYVYVYVYVCMQGAGLSVEDAMQFFGTHFNKIMSNDDFTKKYAYTIRHMYGKEGARKVWSINIYSYIYIYIYIYIYT